MLDIEFSGRNFRNKDDRPARLIRSVPHHLESLPSTLEFLPITGTPRFSRSQQCLTSPVRFSGRFTMASSEPMADEAGRCSSMRPPCTIHKDSAWAAEKAACVGPPPSRTACRGRRPTPPLGAGPDSDQSASYQAITNGAADKDRGAPHNTPIEPFCAPLPTGAPGSDSVRQGQDRTNIAWEGLLRVPRPELEASEQEGAAVISRPVALRSWDLITLHAQIFE